LASKKVKKILVVHGTVLHDKAQTGWKNYLRKKVLIPYLYNMADLTVAVSEGIQYELKEFCGVKKVVSIPNFFDIDEITAKSNQPLPDSLNDIFNSYPVLVTSGRFHIQKNQSALLKLFAKLKEVNPVVKLFLLGDGELRKSLIDQAKELGLKTYAVWDGTVVNEKYDVYFMGYLENPFAYLKKSTLFLFPSGWEGFPMALCEAMISGVVVLTADCPTGPRQILAPGTYDHQYNLKEAEYTNAGVLLPMADKNNFEAQWISAIQNLLNNEHLRINMAKNARHLMQAYDKKKIIGQWLDIINQVLNGVEQ
jgi:glycosyltransferase involved in cell wall biosynthesis